MINTSILTKFWIKIFTQLLIITCM